MISEFLAEKPFDAQNVSLHIERLLALAEKVINVILTHQKQGQAWAETKKGQKDYHHEKEDLQ